MKSMTQEEFRTLLLPIFNDSCHYYGSGNRIFNELETAEFFKQAFLLINKEGDMSVESLTMALLHTSKYGNLQDRAVAMLALLTQK